MDDKQYHVLVSGLVQGVGFRFTVKALANRYSVEGWVKNLAEGKGELLIQGPGEKLNLFLEELKKLFGRNISELQSQESSEDINHKGFQILF